MLRRVPEACTPYHILASGTAKMGRGAGDVRRETVARLDYLFCFLIVMASCAIINRTLSDFFLQNG